MNTWRTEARLLKPPGYSAAAEAPPPPLSFLPTGGASSKEAVVFLGYAYLWLKFTHLQFSSFAEVFVKHDQSLDLTILIYPSTKILQRPSGNCGEERDPRGAD